MLFKFVKHIIGWGGPSQGCMVGGENFPSAGHP